MPTPTPPSFIPSLFKMSLSGDKLTNLPTALQSYIVSNLSSAPRQSVKISLASANTMKHVLQSDLLAVAQSSRALSAVTADALGVQAQILNNATAQPLHEWVTALGKAVKAVSLYDPEVGKRDALGSLRYQEQKFFDRHCDNACKTFKALSGEDVALEVLDVTNISVYRCTRQDELSDSLMNALERSGQSLRELGLRVAPVCAKAVARVSLPSLEIAELKLREVDGSEEIMTSEKGRSAAAFMDMLRALEGQADRTKKKTTLRELKLFNVHEAPCIEAEEGCTGLFSAVKKLRVRVIDGRHDSDSVAKFISLFPNMERLQWNGAVTANHLRTIYSTCTNLEELHLDPDIRYTPKAGSQLPAEGDAAALHDLFVACQGKLRTLTIQAKLTSEQLKILGENNPALEHLAMEIGRENVGALSLLLGSHCRKLQKLDLSFTPDIEECLGEEGWRTFTEGVSSASDELREVMIEVVDERNPMEHAPEAMLQSMMDILEFLGERARKVSFQVPIPTMQNGILVDAVCRVMRACVAHTKCLQILEANFMLVDADYDFDNEEEEKEMYERLVKEMKKLREELPSLQEVFLGGVDELAEERLEEIEAEQ